MTVTALVKDSETRSMTVTTEFAASAERVWRLWEDPRLLERWWGPPTYPATVLDHDLSAGGHVSYLMTGPDGDQPRGWWQVRAVQPPRLLEFEDGFADDTGAPDPTMPTVNVRVSIEPQPHGGTRMTIHSTFPSVEAMDQLLAMGMEDGLTQALGQIDALLDADAPAR
jgi:uncharacterized protein YndB with AHSA1/START domain